METKHLNSYITWETEDHPKEKGIKNEWYKTTRDQNNRKWKEKYKIQPGLGSSFFNIFGRYQQKNWMIWFALHDHRRREEEEDEIDL